MKSSKIDARKRQDSHYENNDIEHTVGLQMLPLSHIFEERKKKHNNRFPYKMLMFLPLRQHPIVRYTSIAKVRVPPTQTLYLSR